MITFTASAKEEITKTFSSPEIPAEYALRVGLKGGACSANYLLGLDKATENDEVYHIEGVKVVIDRKHLMYLIGVKVDYTQTETGTGFVILKG
ncbi:HesB/IscA family protein [Emticicia sp. 17c]|uniref:HesB/IscA family protein n=1 Tax=Emticicia sp. 17c TaxID=3127704 RepID=UPI00301C1D24